MTELGYSLLLFVLLVGVARAGIALQPLLPEHHRSRETSDFVRLVITMLVTFAALVLGLLTTEVKANFDSVGDDIRGYAIQIIDLNRLLVAYGPPAAPARGLLRDYTAAAIATTWTDENPPPNAPRPPPDPHDQFMENSTLGRTLTEVGAQLLALDPADPVHQRLAEQARSRFDNLVQRRWKLIEEASGETVGPLYMVMVLWLTVIFASFGLTAPRNKLVLIIIVMCAASLASVEFVILDLSTPFSGVFVVPSLPMRDAIAHLSER
jgi:hypothetical protein